MRAKKSLGQNFLVSRAVAAAMLRAADVAPEDIILEVGPGKGFITEFLLAAGAGKVVAVEKDDRLIDVLREKFAHAIKTGKCEIIHGDIMETDVENIRGGKPYKVVANIPYYITGELIRFLLENKTPPQKMVIMVQKEVAERIVARDGKESILSISVRAYGVPRYIKTVPARYFRPQPSVDSAILSIADISANHFTNTDKDLFFTIVKNGFAHKRKLLRGNLGNIYEKEAIKEIFNICAVKETARAEECGLVDWICITRGIKNHLTREL